MIISDLHVPFSDSCPTNVEIAYEWNSDRTNYSEQQIGEMPMWIKNMREGSDQVLQENNENIDVDTFSDMQLMQELAYTTLLGLTLMTYLQIEHHLFLLLME